MDSTNNPGGAAAGVQLQGDATRQYAIKRLMKQQQTADYQRPGKPTLPPGQMKLKKAGY